MAALVASDALVDLVKPNGEEPRRAPRARRPGRAGAGSAARPRGVPVLVSRGCRAVLATLGARGAVLTTADGGWHATMPPIVPVSTVGAGDSSLAGYLLADHRGAGPEGRLRQAVAHGSAAASLPGSTMPSPDQTRPDSVTVQPLLPIAADR
ncbi:PfkB family carbohydrate kinase [Clavibacter tessellarius]|uniref:PfkB family carbohydrate kinase n=1 Tax=Clavibacter tessellarius TaxID=31965 RepID=UPI003250C041